MKPSFHPVKSGLIMDESILKNIAEGINQHFPGKDVIDKKNQLSITIGTVTIHFAADGAFIGSESRGP